MLQIIPATRSQAYLNLFVSANTDFKLKPRNHIEKIPHYVINRENHTFMLFINLLIFLSYILLSNKRSELIINILCPFKGPLLSIIIVLSGEQYIIIIFN